MWIRNWAAIALIIATSPAAPGERLPSKDALDSQEALNSLEGNWWKFSCHPSEVGGLGRVTLLKKNAVITADIEVKDLPLALFNGKWSAQIELAPKSFSPELRPKSVCGQLPFRLIPRGCFIVEKNEKPEDGEFKLYYFLGDRFLLSFDGPDKSHYCTFLHTTDP